MTGNFQVADCFHRFSTSVLLKLRMPNIYCSSPILKVYIEKSLLLWGMGVKMPRTFEENDRIRQASKEKIRVAAMELFINRDIILLLYVV